MLSPPHETHLAIAVELQKAQLAVQDEEIRCLKMCLEEEQRRYVELQNDTHTHTTQLHTHIQQLLLQQQDKQRDKQTLQVLSPLTSVDNAWWESPPRTSLLRCQ